LQETQETTQEKILPTLREEPTLITMILPVLKLGVEIQSKIKKKYEFVGTFVGTLKIKNKYNCMISVGC
jgi:hypothetical protein